MGQAGNADAVTRPLATNASLSCYPNTLTLTAQETAGIVTSLTANDKIPALQIDAGLGDIMSTKLRIGNLPRTATEEDLSNKFKQFGIVESAQILKDEKTGNSKGLGLVCMASAAAAKAAISRLNFSQFGDRTMSVTAALPA